MPTQEFPTATSRVARRATESDGLLDLIWDGAPAEKATREIETHYQVVTTALGVDELVTYQARVLEHQATLGAGMNLQLAELCYEPELLADALQGLSGGSAPLGGMAGALNQSLHQWLTDSSQSMLTRQRGLKTILDRSRGSLGAQAQELLGGAQKALEVARRTTGSQRLNRYRHALSFLRSAAAGPVASQDPVVWFQIGWLLWKAEGHLPSAEKAFRVAASLGAPNRDLYHAEAVRHLAYLRYLQGDAEGAYQALSEALAGEPDPDTLFDGARYAALTGRDQEAVTHLRRCLQQRPHLVVALLAEPDFLAIGEARDALARELCEDARALAAASLRQWGEAMRAVDEATADTGCGILLPVRLREGHEELRARVEGAGYLAAVVLAARAEAAEAEVSRTARTALVRALNSQAREVLSRRAEAEAARRKAAEIERQAREREQQEIDALTRERGEHWLFESLGIGFALSLLLAFVGSLALLSAGSGLPTWQEMAADPSLLKLYSTSMLCLLVGGPLGWVAFRYNLRERRFARRLRQIREACSTAAAEGQQLLQERLPLLQKQLADAEAQRQKIEQALRRVEALRRH